MIMRRIFDISVVLLVLGGIGFVLNYRGQQTQAASKPAEVREALGKLYERSAYYGALNDSMRITGTKFPVAVLPEWFDGETPSNTLLDANHPWIDVAPPGDTSIHPPNPIATTQAMAGFWYNPNTGIFRARVPAHLTDQEALSLYNSLNGVELQALEPSADAARTPLAYTPGQTPAATLATPMFKETATIHEATPQPEPAPPVENIFAYDPDSEWEKQFKQDAQQVEAENTTKKKRISSLTSRDE